MAYEIPTLVATFEADADLSAKQYYFVKITGVDKVDVLTTGTQRPIGVLQNKPSANQDASVLIFGVSKVSSNAALAVGDLIGSSADSQAAQVSAGSDTTLYVAGHVIEKSSAAAGIATAIITGVPFRAA